MRTLPARTHGLSPGNLNIAFLKRVLFHLIRNHLSPHKHITFEKFYTSLRSLDTLENPGLSILLRCPDKLDFIVNAILRAYTDAERMVANVKLIQHNAGRRIEVAGLHSRDKRGRVKRFGTDHYPPTSGVTVFASKYMITVTVVRGKPEHERLSLAMISQIDFIPHQLSSGARTISIVVEDRVTVVDFKEALTPEVD